MTAVMAPSAAPSPGAPRKRRRGLRQGQAASGWLFVSPVLLILGLFLLVPVVMAAWVSVSDWTGRGSPFSGNVHFIGAANYGQVLWAGGLSESDFGTALKNNLWYVILVVPLQTICPVGHSHPPSVLSNEVSHAKSQSPWLVHFAVAFCGAVHGEPQPCVQP